MSIIREFSDDLARTVSRIEPSLVAVHTARACASSGVAWSSNLVVTSAQQLDREEGIEVTAGGRRLPATWIGSDAPSDVAVLRVETELTPLVPGDPSRLRVGELVLGMGRSAGVTTARLGIVSRLGGAFRVPGGTRFDRYIESDLAPVPGLSGGPLVDVEGAFLGVNTAALFRGSLVALPVENVAALVSALVTHGSVRRAQLGVSVQRVALPASLAALAGRRHALIVLGVQPGSAAEEAGVGLGDILTRLGADELSRVEDLQSALGTEAIGARTELELIRAGQLERRPVTPAAKN